MAASTVKHDIEYFIRPIVYPPDATSTFKKYSIDYRWIKENRDKKTYFVVKDKSLLSSDVHGNFRKYYEDEKRWSTKNCEFFNANRIHKEIKITNSIYRKLWSKSNIDRKPLGTIILGYNFRIMFDLGEGHTVDQVQEHYNRCSANFIKHFENMVELVKNKPNLKIKVSGYASNEYDDDLKNITAKAKASNSKLAENRQTAGMEFLTWYFCLPSESIEGGQSNILSTDLDLNQFNRDRSIHFSVTS